MQMRLTKMLIAEYCCYYYCNQTLLVLLLLPTLLRDAATAAALLSACVWRIIVPQGLAYWPILLTLTLLIILTVLILPLMPQLPTAITGASPTSSNYSSNKAPMMVDRRESNACDHKLSALCHASHLLSCTILWTSSQQFNDCWRYTSVQSCL